MFRKYNIPNKSQPHPSFYPCDITLAVPVNDHFSYKFELMRKGESKGRQTIPGQDLKRIATLQVPHRIILNVDKNISISARALLGSTVKREKSIDKREDEVKPKTVSLNSLRGTLGVTSSVDHAGHAHPLSRETSNSKWQCNGKKFYGRCLSGKEQAKGTLKFKCKKCNFDLCEKCTWHASKPLKVRVGSETCVWDPAEEILYDAKGSYVAYVDDGNALTKEQIESKKRNQQRPADQKKKSRPSTPSSLSRFNGIQVEGRMNSVGNCRPVGMWHCMDCGKTEFPGCNTHGLMTWLAKDVTFGNSVPNQFKYYLRCSASGCNSNTGKRSFWDHKCRYCKSGKIVATVGRLSPSERDYLKNKKKDRDLCLLHCKKCQNVEFPGCTNHGLLFIKTAGGNIKCGYCSTSVDTTAPWKSGCRQCQGPLAKFLTYVQDDEVDYLVQAYSKPVV